MNPTRLSILGVALLASCNLFTPTADDDAADTGSASDARVTDLASDASVTPNPDMTVRDAATADMTVVRDVSPDLAATPDLPTTADLPTMNDVAVDMPCEPETDAELCAVAGTACGTAASTVGAQRWEFQAEDNATSICGVTPDGFVDLCDSNGTTSADVMAPVDGDYLIEVIARATVFGEVPALVEIQVDGIVIAQLPLQEQLPDGQLLSVVNGLTAGSHTILFRFPNDAVFNGSDRNVRIDSYAVTGPLAGIVDRCGDTRIVDCGGCASGETCGLAVANACMCACPLSDGTCAALGPHPQADCLECIATGWSGVGGACSDGDPCTVDMCRVAAGLCESTPMTCVRGQCEVGTCGGGVCGYMPATDGGACGVAGVCQAGQCGCADGTLVETNCTDNNDNDCDGLKNCADPDCTGLNCGAGKTCSAGLCQ